MKYSTVHHSIVQYNSLHYNTYTEAHCNTVQYRTRQCIATAMAQHSWTHTDLQGVNVACGNRGGSGAATNKCSPTEGKNLIEKENENGKTDNSNNQSNQKKCK